MNNKTCGDCRFFEPNEFICCHSGDDVASHFIACSEFEPRPRLTNADVIREMPTGELIDVIKCPYPSEVCIHRNMHGYACKCCKRDWLHARAEIKERAEIIEREE